MSDFRQLSDRIWASPQIDVNDVRAAAEQGFALIVNNRPEGEADDQTPGAIIESAAQEAGLAYLAIPIAHAGFSHAQIEEMQAALDASDGSVLAYCRSGTRSTLLWALARAKSGDSPDALMQAARAAGYDSSSGASDNGHTFEPSPHLSASPAAIRSDWHSL